MAEGYEIVHDDLKVNSLRVSWGTGFTINNCHYALVCVDVHLFILVWPASTNDLNAHIYGRDNVNFVKGNGTNSVTFGAGSPDGTEFTITRNGLQISMTSGNTLHAYNVIYV